MHLGPRPKGHPPKEAAPEKTETDRHRADREHAARCGCGAEPTLEKHEGFARYEWPCAFVTLAKP